MIPLEQGSVFRLHARRVKRFFIAVSIPLEQGSVFRLGFAKQYGDQQRCLNPFGTGQCLPTAVVF